MLKKFDEFLKLARAANYLLLKIARAAPAE